MVQETSLDREIATSEGPDEDFLAKTDERKTDSSDKNKSKTKKDHEGNKTVPFYKLFSYADSSDRVLMFVGALAAVANGMSMPFMTIIFGNVIDALGAHSDTKKVVHDVSKVSLDFVYLALGTFLASFLQVTCWIVTAERQASRIKSLYLQAILRQDISFFDKETNSGQVIARMSSDALLIQEAMGEKVAKFIQHLSTFMGGLIVAFFKGWFLTLVLLSFLPPLVISGALMSFVIAKMASRGQEAYSEAATVVDQTISCIRTVASFTGEKQARAKYNKSLVKAYRCGVQEGVASGLGFGSVRLFVYSTYAFAVWYGGKMVLEKGYTGGQVMNVFLAISNCSMALGQASPSLTAFAAGQAAAVKMFETIKRKPDIDSYETSGLQLDDIHGDIELKEVCFSYPSRPNELIFNGFSLSIPSGTNVALVGQSGSGKSTILSLIERFYDPQSGKVLIDGINLKEFQLKWIRQRIGLVSQEPVLFSCSIKENIAYGRDGATDEEIRVAAELADVAKFTNKLPQGLNTMVGEHGTQLSGGQKQRVAIARAILKDPRILLLDEATSALDVESERTVQEALDRIMISRTTIIVAHRLSTIRNADIIAVIHQGKIVEKGSHVELIRDPNGAYSQLIRLQETKREPEQNGGDDNDHRLESYNVESGRQSSQHHSLIRSSSQGSSGVPTTSALVETIGGDSEAPPSTTSHKTKQVSLLRIAYLNKPEYPVLLIGILAATVNGAVLPIMGLLLSRMINTFYEPADKLRKDSKFWAFMYVALAVASFLTYPIKSYLFAVAGCKLIKRIRLLCFEKVIHMEISWFDKAEHSSGALGARLAIDAASIRALVGDALGLLIQDIATTIIALVISFEANWQLSLIILVLLPLLVVNGQVQVKSMQGFGSNAKKQYEEASQIANDAVRSIRTIATFCAEEKVMESYQKKCEGVIKTCVRQGLINGIGLGLSFLFLYFVYACSFYVGAQLVQHGKASISDVFRVFLVLTMAAIALSQSGFVAPGASKARDCAASIFSILDQKSKIDSSDDSGMTLQDVKGEVEFCHVTFKYPTRPNVQILRDFSLVIHSGKTVALVGESGCGKSTVISLLQRFYDPDSGHITLDGINIQKLQIKWLRQQMGLVSQEPVLFNDTIRANIAYGKEDATEAEIVAAAELANAHKFISSLHQGYDTRVGEGGVQLSGGQKQRVAIARGIVKNPRMLLLDEATSALDAESEKMVQDALDAVMVDRTTIVVAHRLSTIKNVDIIAVLKNGVIAEKGKHQTLLNKGGVYASLLALHTSTTASSS